MTYQRRSEKESFQAGDFFDKTRRYFDHNLELTVVKLISGDWYVSTGGEMLVTILGSCVAACIRDPISGISGMNHFLLPGDLAREVDASDAARYGVHAMEQLINGIMKNGGRKDRLELKLFGGGNVLKNSAMIGSKNAAFVREFAQKEDLRIVSEDMEGEWPRRIHFYADSGKVRVRRLQRQEDMEVLRVEREYEARLKQKPVEGDVELF
ncbi:MAG: chemoreceptor glutamine deamidase CheD [Rickettsiales bacterium]|nr:chemoreceptor glutamine deamidase CheD [Rickettsiales bacterium]